MGIKLGDIAFHSIKTADTAFTQIYAFSNHMEETIRLIGLLGAEIDCEANQTLANRVLEQRRFSRVLSPTRETENRALHVATGLINNEYGEATGLKVIDPRFLTASFLSERQSSIFVQMIEWMRDSGVQAFVLMEPWMEALIQRYFPELQKIYCSLSVERGQQVEKLLFRNPLKFSLNEQLPPPSAERYQRTEKTGRTSKPAVQRVGAFDS